MGSSDPGHRRVRLGGGILPAGTVGEVRFDGSKEESDAEGSEGDLQEDRR